MEQSNVRNGNDRKQNKQWWDVKKYYLLPYAMHMHSAMHSMHFDIVNYSVYCSVQHKELFSAILIL